MQSCCDELVITSCSERSILRERITTARRADMDHFRITSLAGKNDAAGVADALRVVDVGRASCNVDRSGERRHSGE